MKKHLFLFFALVICGCSTKPSDVPELFPTQVIVMNGSAPIAGVDVILGLTSETLMVSMSGTTNSSGVAVIRTSRLNWQGNGAAAGDYIVTLTKHPQFEGELSLAEVQALDADALALYSAEQQRRFEAMVREVPEEFGDFATSPFRMTVYRGGENRLEIDMSTVQMPERNPTRRR